MNSLLVAMLHLQRSYAMTEEIKDALCMLRDRWLNAWPFYDGPKKVKE